jgi:ABC-type bacteriocin/lantibiotic exporter with double-glycine peptidase domain
MQLLLIILLSGASSFLDFLAIRFASIEPGSVNNQLKQLSLVGFLLVVKSGFGILTITFLSNWSKKCYKYLYHKHIGVLLTQKYHILKVRDNNKILQRLTDGIPGFIEGALLPASFAFIEMFSLVILFMALLAINQLLTLLTIAICLSVVIPLLLHTVRRARTVGTQMNNWTSKSYEAFEEYKLFGKEASIYGETSFLTEKLQQAFQFRSDARVEMIRLLQFPRYMLEGTLFGIALITLFLFQIINNDTSVASIIIPFGIAGARGIPAIYRLVTNMTSLRSAISNARILEDSLEWQINNEEKKPMSARGENSYYELDDKGISVELRDLTFGFEPREMLISNLSFKLKANSIMAIVGKNGRGKSTLLDLIAGVIPPTTGSITYSRGDEKIGQENLTEYISYVPQALNIGNGTLRKLLDPFERNFSDKALHSALSRAQLELDALAWTLNSSFGKGGINPSGGQAQKIMIARALLRNPKLLLVDEASSFLDKDATSYLANLLFKLKNEMTIILVSHDDDIIAIADKVLEI